MQLPLEVFVTFLGLTVFFILFGILKRIPAFMVAGGMFMFSIVMVTDSIKMGNLVTESLFNSTSNTTTYSYTEDIFEFTEFPKVIFGLLASVFMLTGGLMARSNE